MANFGSEPTLARKPEEQPPSHWRRETAKNTGELMTTVEEGTLSYIKDVLTKVFDSGKETFKSAGQNLTDFWNQLGLASLLGPNKTFLVYAMLFVLVAVGLRLLKIPVEIVGGAATLVLAQSHRLGFFYLFAVLCGEVFALYLIIRTELFFKAENMSHKLVHRAEVFSFFVICLGAITGSCIGSAYG